MNMWSVPLKLSTPTCHILSPTSSNDYKKEEVGIPQRTTIYSRPKTDSDIVVLILGNRIINLGLLLEFICRRQWHTLGFLYYQKLAVH